MLPVVRTNKETLKLLLINASGVVCTEENSCRVIYEIENKENIKYTVVK